MKITKLYAAFDDDKNALKMTQPIEHSELIILVTFVYKHKTYLKPYA